MGWVVRPWYRWWSRTSMWRTCSTSFPRTSSAPHAWWSCLSCWSAVVATSSAARTALRTSRRCLERMCRMASTSAQSVTRLIHSINKTGFYKTFWWICGSSAQANARRSILTVSCWHTSNAASATQGTSVLMTASRYQLIIQVAAACLYLVQQQTRRDRPWWNLCSSKGHLEIRDRPSSPYTFYKRTRRTFTRSTSGVKQFKPLKFNLTIIVVSHIIFSACRILIPNNFSWLVVATTRATMRHFMLFTKYKSITVSNS